MITSMPGRQVSPNPAPATLVSDRLTVGSVKSTVLVNGDGSIGVSTTGGTFVSSDVPPAWSRLILAGIGDAWSVRCFYLSGVNSQFDPDDTWLALTSNREFGVSRSTLGHNAGAAQIQVSPDGGSTIMFAFNISFTAGITPP